MVKWLQVQGIDVFVYYVGFFLIECNNVQECFLNEEGVIVCVIVVFGMGIDKLNVCFVVYFDLFKSMEGYYQEMGCVGCDGLLSIVWMVYGLSDVVNVCWMFVQSDVLEEVKWVEVSKFDVLLIYCEVVICCCQVLLYYFGEELFEFCGNCDVCLNLLCVCDLICEVQMVLLVIICIGNCFGVVYFIDVLLGCEIDKVFVQGYYQFLIFGVGKEYDEKLWCLVLCQFVSLGYLSVDDYFGLWVIGKLCGIFKEG